MAVSVASEPPEVKYTRPLLKFGGARVRRRRANFSEDSEWNCVV